MYQKPQHLLVGDSKSMSKVDFIKVPIACQYENLCSNDTHRIHNEQSKWLQELSGNLPLWSRLKITNCAGYPRPVMFSKNASYEIEIPGRLLSIFGTTTLQTKLINKMKDMENCRLLINILALCVALKCDFKEWSSSLLDNIVMEAIRMYPEILQKQQINDKMLNLSCMNQIYKFEDMDYKVQVQQVATGYLYIRYGVNEFNLARALTWFFHSYQFGLLQCCNRTLAFGCTLDNDYGFFMYDCQNRGSPLFEDQQANSYILRTHHLQILLYCLIMTLNISTEMVKFFIYNVDIRIMNPLEMKSIKKEIYVPTIISDIKRVVEKKVDCGTNNKTPKVSSSTNAFNKVNRFPKNSRISKEIIASSNATVNKNITNPPKEKIASSNATVNKIIAKPPINISNKPIKAAKNIDTTSTKPFNAKINLTTNFLKKPITENKNKISKSEALKIQNKNTSEEIQLDPNKMYYIISVPKESKTTLIIQDINQPNDRKQNKLPEIEKHIADFNENIHCTNNPISQNITFPEAKNLLCYKSESTETLRPDTSEVI